MIDIEEMGLLRTNTIAQMAATLEAGDRAHTSAPIEDVEHYAERAQALYKAVEAIEYPEMSTGIAQDVL